MKDPGQRERQCLWGAGKNRGKPSRPESPGSQEESASQVGLTIIQELQIVPTSRDFGEPVCEHVGPPSTHCFELEERPPGNRPGLSFWFLQVLTWYLQVLTQTFQVLGRKGHVPQPLCFTLLICKMGMLPAVEWTDY